MEIYQKKTNWRVRGTLRDKSLTLQGARLVLVLSFLTNFKLEIRESHDLVKDFGGTAKSWKGNKALGKKIYKF